MSGPLTVNGNDVRVGDTFMPVCNDKQFFVAALKPYTGPLLDLLGEGSQIAETVSDAGRHPITIPANSRYRIVSRVSEKTAPAEEAEHAHTA